MLLAFLIGLAAGVTHVYAGPDHLAALMPLSTNRRLRAAWIGLRWGLGHTVGVLVVAVIALAVREVVFQQGAINLEPIKAWGERLVGIMLIGLGALGIRAAVRHRVHAHTHHHEGGETHTHLHVHGNDAHDPAAPPAGHAHNHAAFGAGTLHGLAGMAHVVAVLPSLALPGLASSFSFLGGYALGSIGAMTVFAGIFGVVTASLARRAPGMVKWMMYTTAIFCVAVGVIWIVFPLLSLPLPELFHEH
jgi:hypothetical protein